MEEQMLVDSVKSRWRVLYYRLWGWQYTLRKRIWRKIKLYFYDFEIAKRKSFNSY